MSVRRSVMIVGPEFIRTCWSLGNAFERLGFEPHIFTFDPERSALTRLVQRQANRSNDRMWFERLMFNHALSRCLRVATGRVRPTLVLLLKPCAPSAANRLALRALPAPVVVWTTDSVARYPEQAALAGTAKRFLVMDGDDQRLPRSTWMPLGFDDRVFRVDLDKRFDLDVLFVGNIFPRLYETRRRAIENLAASGLCTVFRAGYVGSMSDADARGIEWENGPRWISQFLPLDELAALIARSRVCVNVHQDDGGRPINPLFFGAAAAGVCQVTDDRDYLGRWMERGRDYVPVVPDCLVDVVGSLLNEPARAEAVGRAGALAAARHSFVARAEAIIALCDGDQRRAENQG